MSETDPSPDPTTPVVQQQTSLEELFNKDPLNWTDTDVDKIVEALRAQRLKFNAAEGIKQIEGKPRGKATAVPRPKKLEAPADGKQITLSDLGLMD